MDDSGWGWPETTFTTLFHWFLLSCKLICSFNLLSRAKAFGHPHTSCKFFHQFAALVRAGDCSMWGTDPAPDTPWQTSAPDACFPVGPEDPQQNGQNLPDNLPVFSLLTCSYTKADLRSKPLQGIHYLLNEKQRAQAANGVWLRTLKMWTIKVCIW